MFQASIVITVEHRIVELIVMDEDACQWHDVQRAVAFPAECDDAVSKASVDDVTRNFTRFGPVDCDGRK